MPKKKADKKTVKKTKIKKPTVKARKPAVKAKKTTKATPKKKERTAADRAESRRIRKIANNDAVQEVLMKMVGPHGLGIVLILLRRRIMDEFKLSSRLKLDVNFVRSLLYKLYSRKIVSYSKKRDQKKGWWIYSWEIHPNKIVELLIAEKVLELDKLNEMKNRKSNEQTYVCDLCAVEVDFAEAMESSFQCFSCSAPLKHFDNENLVVELGDSIIRVKSEINELEKLKEV